jgi:hypothetical protein
MAEIVPLTVEHLREIRESIDRLAVETRASIDRLAIEIAEVRGEVRETRVALHGLSYLVNLSVGDLRADLESIRDRLGRLERERA